MTDRQLLNLAKIAAENAHAPYSRFTVGAALECSNGKVFTGCNIENAALSNTICAERVAVFKAVSEGIKDFKRLAIYGPGKTYCLPCGACRQVLCEFSDNLELLCSNELGNYVSHRLRDLLPHAFSFK